MSSRRISLTVVVVSYNTRELLRDCLLSILQHAPAGTEVIVVDNASTDGSAELVRTEFPTVRIIANTRNLGYPKAVNQGLGLGSGDYFLVLNADVRLTRGTVKALSTYMEAHTHVGIAAPANVTPEGESLLTVHHDVTLGREILRNLFFTDIWRYRICGRAIARRLRSPTVVDWVTGSCLMVRREVLETVGGMDNAVFMYGEEYDWQLRARKAGWEIHFVPQATVVHHESASAGRKWRTERYRVVTRSTYYFYVKHHGWGGLPVLVFAHVIGSGLRLVMSGILYLVGFKASYVQLREHTAVIQDTLNPELYRWLRESVASRGTD